MNLNADIGQIIRSYFKGKKIESSMLAADNPYKEAIIFGGLTVTVIIVYVFMLYLPHYTDNTKNQDKLEQLSGMYRNYEGLTSQINTFKQELVKQREHYNEILEYFSNSKDLGKLYQSVTSLSSMYNLTIASIKESGASPLPQHDMIEEIRVDVELKGSYNDYMQFKNDLYKNEPLLRIQKESLQVGQDANNPGQIYVKLQFSTYGIDKKPFLEAITDEK